MYAIKLNKVTKTIESIFPCSLPNYYDHVLSLDNDVAEYHWVDHYGLRDVDIGDFLARPDRYTILVGKTPSDNQIVEPAYIDAKRQDIVLDTSDNLTVAQIPAWGKYLVIEALCAPGGYGSGSNLGGGGAYVTNVILDIGLHSAISLTMGQTASASQPNGGETILAIDGNTLYKLAGGVGNVSPVQSTTGSSYNPVAGSGGLWEVSVGGPTFNGDTFAATGPIDGYGGSNQPGYAKMYFTSEIPNLDAPIVSIDISTTLTPQSDTTPALPVTVTKGITNLVIPDGVNYICVSYACAAGGYGRTGVGGQGSYLLGTWWRVYPGDQLTLTVGAGGSATANDYGNPTSMVLVNQNGTNPLFILNGGQSSGTGGIFTAASGNNVFKGRDATSTAPLGVMTKNGQGGNQGENGGDGVIVYSLSSAPPRGVTIYDSRIAPLYDRS